MNEGYVYALGGTYIGKYNSDDGESMGDLPYLPHSYLIDDLVVDDDENIYITMDNEILKLDIYGNLLTTWNDNLFYHKNIALDFYENVNTLGIKDDGTWWVRKYAGDGTIIAETELPSPADSYYKSLAIDFKGYIYVAYHHETYHHGSYYTPKYDCLRKFTTGSTLITEWCDFDEQGYLSGLASVAVDIEGNIYTSFGSGKNYIDKFTPTGMGRPFIVDNTPPLVVLDSSLTETVIGTQNVNLFGTITDVNPIDNMYVTLLDRTNTPVGPSLSAVEPGTTEQNWSIYYPINKSTYDDYNLQIKAADQFGNTITQTFPGLTFDQFAPQVDVYSATLAVNDKSPIILGTATDVAYPGNKLLHLHFEETVPVPAPSKRIFYDGSKSRFKGTCSADSCPTTDQTGQYGLALNFDGSDDYLRLDDAITIDDSLHHLIGSMTNELTIMTWLKPNNTLGIQRLLSTSTANSNNGFAFGLSDGGLQFSAYSVDNYNTTNTMLSSGVWYHVAVVMATDNTITSTVTLYVNGQEVERIEHDTPIQVNNDDEIIIGSRDGTSEFFNGVLDELVIYDRALTAKQIDDIANPIGDGINNIQISFHDSTDESEELTLTYNQQWGGEGDGEGEFQSPTDIAVDSSDNVYVLDRVNHRIQKFDGNGALLAIWGRQGVDDGQFYFPNNIAVDKMDNIYVTQDERYFYDTKEYFPSHIQKFDSNGNFLDKWEGKVRYNTPYGITVDSKNNIYVTFGNDVKKFDSNFNLLDEWKGIGGTDSDIVVDGDNYVYVTVRFGDCVEKFDSDGTFITKFAGQFNEPQGITIGNNGTIYVTDAYNHRVQEFDSNGTFLAEWGSHGSDEGQFNYPSGIEVDSNNNIYVADYYNDRVQKFVYVNTLNELTSWQDVELSTLNSHFTTWQYQFPYSANVEDGLFWGYLKTKDVLVNTRVISNVWEGVIDVQYPEVTVEIEDKGDKYHLTTIATDFNLSEDNYTPPCDNNVITERSNLNEVWYNEIINKSGADPNTFAKLNRLRTTCDVNKDFDKKVTACDLYGHCTTLRCTPDGCIAPTPTPSPTPVFVTKWGSEGDGDGEFNNPRGIAVDGSSDSEPFTDTTINGYLDVTPYVASNTTTITGYLQADNSLRDVGIIQVNTNIYSNSWASGAITETWFTLPLTLTEEGQYILKMTAYDWLSDTVTVFDTITLDTMTPTLSLSTTVITATDYNSNGYISLSGAIVDTAIDRVMVNVGASTLALTGKHAVVENNTWHVGWDIGTAGSYPTNINLPIMVTATDRLERVAVVSDTIFVDTKAPSLTGLTVAYGHESGTGSAILPSHTVISQYTTIRDVLSPTLFVNWNEASDENGVVDYQVTWIEHLSQTTEVLETSAVSEPMAKYTVGEAKKISIQVTAKDMYGNTKAETLAPVYIDYSLTPAYIDLEEYGKPYNAWQDDTCNLLGTDNRIDKHNSELDSLSEPQNFYTTWNDDGLHLAWTGADWQTDGDLFIYFDTKVGGSSVAYNPYPETMTDTVILLPPAETTSFGLQAKPEGFGLRESRLARQGEATVGHMEADYMLWVQEDTTYITHTENITYIVNVSDTVVITDVNYITSTYNITYTVSPTDSTVMTETIVIPDWELITSTLLITEVVYTDTFIITDSIHYTDSLLMEWDAVNSNWSLVTDTWDYMLDTNIDVPHTNIFIPFETLGISHPVSQSLSMVAFATENDGLKLWATMPSRNMVNSDEVVDVSIEEGLEIFTLLKKYSWSSLGSGICPSGMQTVVSADKSRSFKAMNDDVQFTADNITAHISTNPPSLAYTMFGDNLIMAQDDLLDDVALKNLSEEWCQQNPHDITCDRNGFYIEDFMGLSTSNFCPWKPYMCDGQNDDYDLINYCTTFDTSKDGEHVDPVTGEVLWDEEGTIYHGICQAGIDFNAKSELSRLRNVNYPYVHDGQIVTYTIQLQNEGQVDANDLYMRIWNWGPVRLSVGEYRVDNLLITDTHVLTDEYYKLESQLSIPAGMSYTLVFTGLIDNNFNRFFNEGWATVDVTINDRNGSLVELLYADYEMDQTYPDYVEITSPQNVIGQGPQTIEGVVFDQSEVPTITLQVAGNITETFTCVDDTPQDHKWSCDIEINEVNDGDTVMISLVASDEYNQTKSSLFGGRVPFVVDTSPPSITLNVDTTQPLTTILLSKKEEMLQGEIYDNRLVDAVEVCQSGTEICQEAKIILDSSTLPQTTYIYEDVPESPVLFETSATCGSGNEVVRTFVITDDFIIADMDFGLNIDHRFRNDVVVMLRSPWGKELSLHGFSPKTSNIDVLINDTALMLMGGYSSKINDTTNHDTTKPYYENELGPWPSLLRHFYGHSALGTWIMTLCDVYPDADEGTYNRSQLRMRAFAPPLNTAATWQYDLDLDVNIEGISRSLTIYGIDAVGNRMTEGQSYNYAIDTKSPEISMTQQMSQAISLAGNVSLAGTVSDGSAIQNMQISIFRPDSNFIADEVSFDGDIWSYINTNILSYVFSHTEIITNTAGLTETVVVTETWAGRAFDQAGDYTYWIEAIDMADNQTTIGSYSLRVTAGQYQIYLPLVLK